MPEKTVAEKLLIKPGKSLRFVNAPSDLSTLMGSMPEGLRVVDDSAGPNSLIPADIIVLFANGRTDLETLLPGLRTALTPGGLLWVLYHKGTSAVKTDINRDTINSYASTIGLQGVAMVSINEDWSGLRLKVV